MDTTEYDAEGNTAEESASYDAAWAAEIEAAADLADADIARERAGQQDRAWLQEVGERYQQAGERPSGQTADGEPEYGPDGNPSADSDADAAQYEHDAGSWLARDGDGQVLEVDAEGHPGREASPDDGRPVADAVEPSGHTARELAAVERDPVVRENLNRIAGYDALADDAEEEFAAYWGGEGPAWEAQAEATTAEPAPGTGPHDVPWWDGERMASDRERTPDRVAEMEAEAG